MLDEDAIPEHGDVRGCEQRRAVELRGLEDDVVGLPLPGLAGDVDERRVLAIDRCRLAVSIGDVLVRIQHLHLIAAHEGDAAVAAVLARASSRARSGELHMQLHVTEFLARHDRSRAGSGLEVAIFHWPRRVRLLPLPRVLPLRQVLAVEEHDRIRRRHTWRCARGNDPRMRTGDVMNAPGRARISASE